MKVFSKKKKKKSSLRFAPQFPDFIPKMKVFSQKKKKKGLHFNSLISYFGTKSNLAKAHTAKACQACLAKTYAVRGKTKVLRGGSLVTARPRRCAA